MMIFRDLLHPALTLCNKSGKIIDKAQSTEILNNHIHAKTKKRLSYRILDGIRFGHFNFARDIVN